MHEAQEEELQSRLGIFEEIFKEYEALEVITSWGNRPP